MIRLLKGSIEKINIGSAIIMVGSVGYFVRTLGSYAPIFDETATLHTYLAVRETALDLYGFENEDELAMFELLLTIPKIGPKSALQILNQARVPIIKKAVIDEDPSYLSKLSDVTKKTAEKIVLALKNKIDTSDLVESDAPENTSHLTEVVETLIALGYQPKAAREACADIPDNITEIGACVRIALAYLTRR